MLGEFKYFHKELWNRLQSQYFHHTTFNHRELACEVWPALIQPMVSRDTERGSNSSLPQESHSHSSTWPPWAPTSFTLRCTGTDRVPQSCTNTLTQHKTCHPTSTPLPISTGTQKWRVSSTQGSKDIWESATAGKGRQQNCAVVSEANGSQGERKLRFATSLQ